MEGGMLVLSNQSAPPSLFLPSFPQSSLQCSISAHLSHFCWNPTHSLTLSLCFPSLPLSLSHYFSLFLSLYLSLFLSLSTIRSLSL